MESQTFLQYFGIRKHKIFTLFLQGYKNAEKQNRSKKFQKPELKNEQDGLEYFPTGRKNRFSGISHRLPEMAGTRNAAGKHDAEYEPPALPVNRTTSFKKENRKEKTTCSK